MSFQQGLSGLNAAASNLNVIGNNVANANTVGAKASRAEFADLYATSLLGGGGGGSIGIGVTVANVAQQFTQGDIATTSNPLDVAINGSGFFQVSNNGASLYTRNGQFKMDSQGYIVTNSGAHLQGFMADSTGQLTKVPTDMKLSVDGVSPKQTSQADISLNLDSRTAVPTSTFSITDPTSYSGVSSMTVYSGQGQSHTLGMYFVKSAANTWNVQASLDGTLFPNNPAMTLHFDSAGKITSPSGPVTLAVPVPASEGGPMNIAMNVGQVTQFGSAFAIADQAQNGYGAGDLAGFSIGNDGTVQARYSNGHTVTQGQITLVNFRNPQGLNPLGGNVWTESAASGSPLTPQAPGTGSLGTVQSGALEQSNVDLTGELVNMITAQRVYQANAQTIKAEDTLLQTIVNLR